jgi:hypothetical protein
MKGYRFYLEHNSPQDKRKGNDAGNVIAISTDIIGRDGDYEGLASVTSAPDSDVNWGNINIDYLEGYCKRISEEKAREIHPRLFARLDEENKGE